MNQDINIEHLIQQIQNKQFSQRIKDRLVQFIEVLNQDKIDLTKLASLCEKGIPDDLRGLRSICWKLLTGYLPSEKNKWKQEIDQQYQTYHHFCSEFLKQKLTQAQINKLDEAEIEGRLTQDQAKQIQKQILTEESVQDHPLSRKKSSNWSQFFEDQDQWDEIEKDTIRTRSELSFFQSPTQIPNRYPVQFRTQILRERKYNKDLEHKHFDVLTRILFIYAKLNPAIKYVQGMNEILAPIYYAYYNDTSPYFLNSVESDAFFTFTIFMGDAKESFIRSLDNSQDGLRGRMDNLNKYLKVVDEELWEHLEKLHINPQFYSLRWIMLYLTQEFELFDVLRLWDSLLSKKSKNKFLVFLCLGILSVTRNKLLVNDFADVMEALQRLDGEDVLQIIYKANELYKE